MLPREVSTLLLLLLLAVTFDLSVATPPTDDIIGHYLNEFAVEVEGGSEVAERVARESGFELVSQVT